MEARTAAFTAVRQVRHYPYKVGGIIIAVGAVGILAGAHRFALVSSVVLLGVTGWWWILHVQPAQTVRMHVAREGDLTQRARGVATWLDVQEVASPWALRRQAAILRPSLAGTNRRQIPPTELGVMVARVGFGLRWGQQIWSSCEDVTTRIGGPRTGKSMSLACHGIDAPGALITTSTKLDLAGNVHQTRNVKRVHLANIAGVGGVPSTVCWSVIAGCRDWATAARKAALFLPDVGDKERDYWAGQARNLLTLLLHGADVGGRNMTAVLDWCRAEKGSPAARDLVTILGSVSDGGLERAGLAQDYYDLSEKTRTSVAFTLGEVLRWVADPGARGLGDAPPNEADFDPVGIIARGETLHIVGGEDRPDLAPLVAAFMGEIMHEAKQMAAVTGGRLDPPVTVLLDEADRVCPVPLHLWTADFGGRGITLHISVQSIAQLRERWSGTGADTILTNSAVLLAFGGSRNARELQEVSALFGEQRQRVIDADGVKDPEWFEHRWTSVLSVGDLANLKRGQVACLRRGLRPVFGHAPTVLDRKKHGWEYVNLAQIHRDRPQLVLVHEDKGAA